LPNEMGTQPFTKRDFKEEKRGENLSGKGRGSFRRFLKKEPEKAEKKKKGE